MLGQVKEALRATSNRIRLTVTKALIKAVYDNTEIQLVKVQALDSEIFDNVERLQPYGLTTNPALNSEAIMAEIGGSRDHLVVMIVDSAANRIKDLKSGETCFYSEHGQKILHNENGDTEHTATIHKFNGGGRGVARINDETLIDSNNDEYFMAWVKAVHSVCLTLASASLATYTIPAEPKSITGKINSSSSEVEMPND